MDSSIFLRIVSLNNHLTDLSNTFFLAKSYLSKSKKINYSLEKKDLETFFNLDKKKFIENYLNNYKIKFIFIFIGKNYKKVKDNNFVNNSINYEIPIRILKKLK